MSGVLSVVIGGTAGAGGGSPLVASIGGGEYASNFDSDSWTWNTAICTASGGTPPYSYQWSWTSTSGGIFGFASSSALASTLPAVSGVARSSTATGSLRCQVTDSAGVPVVVFSASELYQYENVF
jgi:hypothetical protein